MNSWVQIETGTEKQQQQQQQQQLADFHRK